MTPHFFVSEQFVINLEKVSFAELVQEEGKPAGPASPALHGTLRGLPGLAASQPFYKSPNVWTGEGGKQQMTELDQFANAYDWGQRIRAAIGGSPEIQKLKARISNALETKKEESCDSKKKPGVQVPAAISKMAKFR